MSDDVDLRRPDDGDPARWRRPPGEVGTGQPATFDSPSDATLPDEAGWPEEDEAGWPEEDEAGWPEEDEAGWPEEGGGVEEGRPKSRRRRRSRRQPVSESAADQIRRRRRRLSPPARGVRRCLVVATSVEDTTAVELRSGAFVRLRIDGPDDEQELKPFDVVDAMWADDPQRDDLAQPEAVSLSGPPRLVGALRGRRARRVLKTLVAPPAQQLLGFAGSAAPYWEFHGMRPSVALVAPSRGPLLFRRRADHSVWARFGWPGSDHWLPVEDPRALAALRGSGRERLAGRGLAAALGFRPHYLVVTVSRPRQGHCYKTVAAMLPRP